MDHLGEVAGADLAGVHESTGLLGTLGRVGSEGVEDGLHRGDVGRGAADHQGVAVLTAPDPAADAAVEVADALLGQQVGVLEVVRPARVATVDDDVALAEQLAELGDRGARGFAGGHHDPHDLGARQGLDELGDRADVADRGITVVTGDGDTVLAQALTHVAAHLAQADESEMHRALQRRSQVWRRTGMIR